MALYTIADTHLSFGCEKPMDIFPGWHDYASRLQENWEKTVGPEDTVVIPGDVSWGMNFAEALPDFLFLNRLPGKKILLKGNHDYWWSTKNKMDRFLAENGLESIQILHNNSVLADGFVICGCRGWVFENGQPQDQKILAREAGRLRLSLESAKGKDGEVLVFLHYPPLLGETLSAPIIDVLLEYGVKRVFFGHLHGAAHAYAFQGRYMGIDFRLVAGDYLSFCPKRIELTEK